MGRLVSERINGTSTDAARRTERPRTRPKTARLSFAVPLCLAASIAGLSCQTLRRGERRQPPKSSEWARAEALFLADRMDEARAAFTKISTGPYSQQDRATARYWRGRCNLRLGYPAQAKRDFEVCLSMATSAELRDLAKEGLADCFRLQGDLERAAQLYEEVASRAPAGRRRASLLYRSGMCHIQSGNWSAGRRALRSAANAHPAFRSKAQAVLNHPGDFFTVQVGFFRQRANADRLVAGLRSKGLPAELRVQRTGEGTCHAVWSGRFTTRPEAQRHLERLNALGFEGFVLP